MQALRYGNIRTRQRGGAVAVAVVLTVGIAACSGSGSSSDSGKPKSDAATAPSSLLSDPSAETGSQGACLTAMNALLEANSKTVGIAGDTAKAIELMTELSTRLAAASGRIGDPAAKQDAQDLAAIFGKAAQDMKDGTLIDGKDLQGKVAADSTGLAKCATAEG